MILRWFSPCILGTARLSYAVSADAAVAWIRPSHGGPRSNPLGSTDLVWARGQFRLHEQQLPGPTCSKAARSLSTRLSHQMDVRILVSPSQSGSSQPPPEPKSKHLRSYRRGPAPDRRPPLPCLNSK